MWPLLIAKQRQVAETAWKIQPEVYLFTEYGVFHRVCPHVCVHKFLIRIFAKQAEQRAEGDLYHLVDLPEDEIEFLMSHP